MDGWVASKQTNEPKRVKLSSRASTSGDPSTTTPTVFCPTAKCQIANAQCHATVMDLQSDFE
jgi:hypothetical protein